MRFERLNIADLSADPANARKHSERNIESIMASLRRFGQQKPIVVDKSGVVRAGNGTLEAAKRLGWTEIDAALSDLQGSEMTAYAIADNRTAELAEWDDEILVAVLETLDHEDLLSSTGFTEDELKDLLGSDPGAAGGSEDTYTSKIVLPVYEPKGDCPKISDLMDTSKRDRLVKEIERSKLPDEVKRFLVAASERHVVFHFGRIAEFYCHQEAEVQNLMERNALVIIDFDKAVENGFVHMSDRLGALAQFEEFASEDVNEE